MNRGASYFPCDGVDNFHDLPMSESSLGAPTHNTEYGNCPVMTTMNTISFASPGPVVAPNTGPFVTMHLSYYLSLMNQIEGRTQPGGPFAAHLSEPSTSAVEAGIVPTIATLSLEAPEHALQPTASTEGAVHPGKSYGKRSKVACNSCSDAHKTCDQGLPCGRCTKRGLDTSCEYPPTKGGRRVRKTIVSLANGAQRAGMSYMPVNNYIGPSLPVQGAHALQESVGRF